MPKTYKHLNEHERDILTVLKSKGKPIREIARVLKRDPSTLSRELRRNAAPVYKACYLPHKAHKRAAERNRESHRRRRLKNDFIRRYVAQGIKRGWSPELIAGWLRRQHSGYSISPEAIYQWIYFDARQLIPCLVRAHRRRRYRGYVKGKHKKTHIPERVSIKERPLSVQRRFHFGHWETDTLTCRKSHQAVQVSVERKARYSKIAKLKARTSRAMSTALARRLSRLPKKLRLSITYDNGPENAEHARTNRILGTRSYFCEPFHSYERGTVENTIGLVRRFIPKRTNLRLISQAKLRKIESWLNNRPRKILGFKTPAEVFQTSAVALAG